jgi:hypothetical protein
MANSPIKAWRLVFTAGILEKIVNHTNKYGYRNAKQGLVSHHKEGLDGLFFCFILDVCPEKERQAFQLVLRQSTT